MQLRINLNNPPSSDKINVDVQWNVEVLKPKGGFLPRIFRRHNQVERFLKISVSNINVPQDIVCDKNKLFSLLYKDKITAQSKFPVDVLLDSMAMPFQLLFHPREIKDCLRPQDANPRSYTIKFDVNLSDEDNNVIYTKPEQIEIIFEPLGVKTQFSIDLPEEQIQYSSSLGREQVGLFAAWLDEEFSFTPEQMATISLKLFQGRQEIGHTISFEKDKEEEKVTRSIKIKAGRKNVVKLPLYVDFSNISNPIKEEEDYTIEAKIVLSASYSPEVKETILKQKHFKLKKDLQGTELKVYIKEGDSIPALYDMGKSYHTKQMRFVPGSKLMGIVSLVLSNVATDNSNPRAGLHIKNFILSEAVQGDVQIVGPDGIYVSHLVNIDGSGIEAMSSTEGLFIPNGADAKTVIDVTLDPSRIIDLRGCPTYDFQVRSTLSFDYWEDKDGTGLLNEANKKIGEVPILWQLHLEPRPEWLCVDYGSSAIVCQYDQSVINLKNQKDRIFRNENDGNFSVDNIETGTPFLSSDIVLHTVREPNDSTLCSQQPAGANAPYLSLSVCLSPTSSLINYDVRTQLPCLKILVGNEYLPLKPDFKSFKYCRRDKDGKLGTVTAEQDMRNNEPSCILRIDSIFNEAYAALFRYFIFPQSRDKDINKLVLTYPNTYTPTHLKVLERIAHDTFPKIRKGYLRFVSESDAVAAYYIQNWDSFNKSRDWRINDDETVLVYDMGAGTLDISLFKKTKNRHSNKIEVSILGKIGTGKAGNYLDYLISEIIVDKVPEAIREKRTVSTKHEIDSTILAERVNLKDSVKNGIKPNLKPGKELICGGIKFDSSVILNDERFIDFLHQVTDGIIKQLIDYLGDKNLKIDTVLMSGRSCRLESLQQALRRTLKQTGNPQAYILKFSSNHDKEKTVVVEGAMARAGIFSSLESHVTIRSRRLYASYGLIYKMLGGTYRYTELLRGSDTPFVEDNTALSDFDGPTVEARGTANAGTIKLIQTYLSKEDTEKAYNNGDFEFISEMEEYNMADFGNKDTLNVKLRLDYKNNISLYVNSRKSIGSSPKGVDLSSEITKRSIWPVTI